MYLNIDDASHLLLGEVVHGPGKVQNLEYIHPPDSDPWAPGHVVGLPCVVGGADLAGGPAHEVVEEVVHQVDDVHDGLRALDNLTVQRGLDIRLNIEIIVNINTTSLLA